jgi:hypothetical protein
VLFAVDVATHEGRRTQNQLGVVKLPYIGVHIAVNEMLPHLLFTTVSIIHDVQDNVNIKKEEFLGALQDAILNYPTVREQLIDHRVVATGNRHVSVHGGTEEDRM